MEDNFNKTQTILNRQAQRDAYEKEHEEKVREILDKIGEDFVEPVANFYVGKDEKRVVIELWNTIKKRYGGN